MPKTGIVCDSTCDLGTSWLAENDVVMVPLKVLFGDESFRDWVDMEPDEFYSRLAKSPTLPKTSQPSPAEFQDAYGRLADAGCDEIVSVHLSSALSGTVESANLAAAESPVPVRIVDTKLVTQGTALVLKAAIEARKAGLDADGIERAANAAASGTQLFFILDTLDYLVKGGRAGRAQGLAASLLNIKPVLCINKDGVVEPFKKVKGFRKAISELAAHVAAETPDETKPARLTVLHACAQSSAEDLIAALDSAGAHYELDSVGLVGAVIGTYAGPGAVGLAYHRPL